MTVLHDLWHVLWLATWANNLAALEWATVLGLIAALKRDAIGRHLAKWWDRHHGPKAVERHKQALREHDEEREQQ